MEKNNTTNFTHWFFDLDNTLYCANSGIFDQIHKKMGEFISNNLKISLKKAKILQNKYFIENGTTLHGLMINHRINPKKFLEYVHDIDFGIIKHNKKLNNLIKKIPGKKIIFTNADTVYVKKVLKQLRLINEFDDIFDIEKAGYKPKPDLNTYKKLIKFYSLKVDETILFDDIPKNLLSAAQLGITTVHIYNKYLDKELNGRSKKIDYITYDLKEWLQKWIQNN